MRGKLENEGKDDKVFVCVKLRSVNAQPVQLPSHLSCLGPLHSVGMNEKAMIQASAINQSIGYWLAYDAYDAYDTNTI